MRYGWVVIQSFADKETEKVFNRRHSRRLPEGIQRRAQLKLRMLDAAEDIVDLGSPPGNALEALEGGRRGQHSIRINARWRICFLWLKGNSRDVEIVDYHKG